MRVLIDPGHGGDNTGTLEGPEPEKDLNLKVALALYENLRGDFEVHLTRFRDEALSLMDRVRMSYRLRPDVFLSVHHNALGEPRSELYTSWNMVSPSYDLAYTIYDLLPQDRKKIPPLPSLYTVMRAKAKVKLLLELFLAREANPHILDLEVGIVQEALKRFSQIEWAREPDPMRSFGKYSAPKGKITTFFRDLTPKPIPTSKQFVVLRSGRLFWDAVELSRRLGWRLLHYGMSKQLDEVHVADLLVRSGSKGVLVLDYGPDQVSFYYRDGIGRRMAETISAELGLEVVESPSYLLVQPKGWRIELRLKGCTPELIRVLKELTALQ